MTRDLIARTQAFASGVDFTISYGMTEASSPAVPTPPGSIERRPDDAVGVAVPVSDVAVDDDGEMLFSRPNLDNSYDSPPEANERAFSDGCCGAAIYVRSTLTAGQRSRRLKDVINRRGEKIASLEVEAVLTEHPAVREAAVVPKPDPVYGETPRAVVVAEGVTAEELVEFARARLAPFKVPVDFAFVDELPRNPGGKILKQLLR